MRTLEATVVSTKMQKTIIVRVDRKFRHPRYGKVLKKQKKYKVHCEEQGIKPGDLVVIQETKPISKDKHFMFVRKLKSATNQELIKNPVVEEKNVVKTQTVEMKKEVKTKVMRKRVVVAKKQE